MLLRIYSIGRFIITLILFCIIAWYGFSTLSQFHVRTNKAVVSINDLIQTTKDSQINLEKYRLFEQSAQLDAVATSVDLAEKKLNEMLKRVQHDKKKSVIPNLVRDLEFGDGYKSCICINFFRVRAFLIAKPYASLLK